MVTDQQVRNIALFFFFTFLDEKVAFEAAHKVVSALKAARLTDDAIVISAMRKYFEQYKKSIARNRNLPEFGLMVELPKNFDFALWRKFQKSSPENEIVALVLSKILNYSDEDVASGLNISLGTARYRIGKGVRNLGEVVRRA